MDISEKLKIDIATKRIKNPSEELQLIAVGRDGHAIEYIDNPSEKVKLAAIKQDGYVIEYVSNPSEKMKLTAVKQNGNTLQYINKPSDEIKLAAVKKDGTAIRYISCASEEIQLASLWNFKARKYVTCGLNLPTIHYKWIHDCSGIFLKKNLKNRTKKYSDINIRC